MEQTLDEGFLQEDVNLGEVDFTLHEGKGLRRTQLRAVIFQTSQQLGKIKLQYSRGIGSDITSEHCEGIIAKISRELDKKEGVKDTSLKRLLHLCDNRIKN